MTSSQEPVATRDLAPSQAAETNQGRAAASPELGANAIPAGAESREGL
jgi:hypothetical protein